MMPNMSNFNTAIN